MDDRHFEIIDVVLHESRFLRSRHSTLFASSSPRNVHLFRSWSRRTCILTAIIAASHSTMSGRCGRRTRVLSKRGESFNLNQQRKNVPNEGDDILVKWMINDTVLWWPATVITVLPASTSKTASAFTGIINYEAYGRYQRQSADVVFLVDEKGAEKRLKHREGDNQEVCSWVYAEQGGQEDAPTSRIKKQRRSTPSSFKDSSGSVTSASYSDKHVEAKHEAEAVFRSRRNRRQRAVPLSNQPPSNQDKLHQTTPTEEKHEEIQPDTRSSGVVGSPGNSRRTEDLANRIQLIERRLSTYNNQPVIESAGTAVKHRDGVHGVIVPLRWALLKKFQVPIKPKRNAGYTAGFTVDATAASTSCTLTSFISVCGHIISTFNEKSPGSSDQLSGNRITFSPTLNKIFSGSSALSNIAVYFTTLSDVCHFLGVNDEDDYEKLICKEVVSNSNPLIRVVGVLSTPITSASSSSVQTDGSEKSSTTAPRNNIFIGTSAVTDCREDTAPCRNEIVNTTLLYQEARNWDQLSSIYESKWASEHRVSERQVHVDEDSDPLSLRTKFFILHWSKDQLPASSIWSADVFQTSSSVPGTVTLSIPILTSSNVYIVNSLSSLLDRFIEQIMDDRSNNIRLLKKKMNIASY